METFVGRASRVALRAILSAAVALTIAGCSSVPIGEPVRLTVVHVNDTHGHLFPFSTADDPRVRGGWARLATLVSRVLAAGKPVLLLHGGDAIVGSPTRYLTGTRPDYDRIPSYGWRGLDSVEAMNRLRFDAMVVGNHELDYGKRWLDGLVARAQFPVLSGNLERKEAPDVDGANGTLLAKPYVVLGKGGLRIAVIGLTTQEYLQSLQVKISDPVEAARRLVAEAEGRADLVIVLSHLGAEEDAMLAEKVPGIDLIVGGHSHTLLAQPAVRNGTLIVQAGEHGEHAGVLDLEVQGGRIASWSYAMRDLDASMPADAETEAALRSLLDLGSVGDRVLRSVKQDRSGLGSLATAAMLAAVPGAGAALIAADALSGEIGPGRPDPGRFFDVFWPYHRRGLPPEKDMGERQLLSTLRTPPSGLLRTLVRDSNGLRTLVTVRIPAKAFSDWLAVDEGRRGADGYVQADLRGPAGPVEASVAGAAALPAPAVDVVMPIDLALRLSGLGLETDGAEPRTAGVELFEAVIAFLRAGGAARP